MPATNLLRPAEKSTRLATWPAARSPAHLLFLQGICKQDCFALAMIGSPLRDPPI